MSGEIMLGRVSTGMLRVRLAKALPEADCGCEDFSDPLTDEDERYITAVDIALASLVEVQAHPLPSWHMELLCRLRDEVLELVEEVRALEAANQKLNDRYWADRRGWEAEAERRAEAATRLCRELRAKSLAVRACLECGHTREVPHV